MSAGCLYSANYWNFSLSLSDALRVSTLLVLLVLARCSLDPEVTIRSATTPTGIVIKSIEPIPSAGEIRRNYGLYKVSITACINKGHADDADTFVCQQYDTEKQSWQDMLYHKIQKPAEQQYPLSIQVRATPVCCIPIIMSVTERYRLVLRNGDRVILSSGDDDIYLETVIKKTLASRCLPNMGFLNSDNIIPLVAIGIVVVFFFIIL